MNEDKIYIFIFLLLLLQCYTAHELLNVYNISHSLGITESEFTDLSPSLVQQIVQGCAAHEEAGSADPTPGESKYSGLSLK